MAAYLNQRQIHGFDVHFYGYVGEARLQRYHRLAFFDGFANACFECFDHVARLRSAHGVLVAANFDILVLVFEFRQLRLAVGYARHGRATVGKALGNVFLVFGLNAAQLHAGVNEFVL